MINNIKNRTFVYILPLFCLLIFFILKSLNRPADDFAGYYFGSKFFLQGSFNASTIYETFMFNDKIYTEGYRNIWTCYTPFPPITSLFFLPFTFFDLFTAKLIFNSLSVPIFLFSLIRLVKFLNLPNWVFLLIPLVLFIPLRNNIFFGQVYLILFSLMVEGFVFYKKEKYLYASLLWGLAIVLKIFPIICLLFLLFKKDWKQFRYLTIAIVLLSFISFFFNGVDVWKTYLLEVFPRVSNGELNDSFTCIFQSAFMLLKNVFTGDSLLNPDPIYNSPYLFVILLAAFKTCVISTCVIFTIKKNTNNLLCLAMWTIASILISPNGSTYSLILLLIPLIALLNSDISTIQKAISIVLLFLICNIPITYFSSFPLLSRFPRLYLILLLFILNLINAKIRFNYKAASVSLLLFLSLESFRLIKPTDESAYFLNREEHILIYDYMVKENKLVYSYVGAEGRNEAATEYNVTEYTTDNLALNDNQIFYLGKKLTNSPDRKRKPMLFNREYIVYLSDKNRGVGFYTLRKLKLNN